MVRVHGYDGGMENSPPRAPDAPPLPPQVVASPSDLPAGADDEPMWWRPSFADSMRYIGWRWLLVVPMLAVLVMAVAMLLFPQIFPLFAGVGIKFALTVGALAVSLCGYVYREAARGRKEPFCIHCGYNLTGLPDGGTCPECGRPYSWRVIEEYRRDPAWFIQRWRTQRMSPPTHAPFEAGPRRSKRSRDGT